MAQVITFVGYKPIERYDSIPWTEARIEESDTAVFDDILVWSEVETVTLTPVDAEPSDPVYRNFTTELASDTPGLWYRIVWVDASLDESSPTDAVQNVVADVVMYATTDELRRIVLKNTTPSAAQESAMERVLIASSGEINSEIDLSEGATLTGWQLALASQVCLERAAELWKLQEVQFGIILGSETGQIHIGRDTWKKHSITLAPLKNQFGFA